MSRAKVRWIATKSGFQHREVFTIDGVEYVRTKTPELAHFTITQFRTPGLGPLYLRRRDSLTSHMRRAA